VKSTPGVALRSQPMRPDAQLPGLETLLDISRVRSLLVPALHPRVEFMDGLITHVRYKPSTSALVAYRFAVLLPGKASPRPLHLYGKCYRKQDYGAAIGKLGTHRWVENFAMTPVLASREHAIIFYGFPNDRVLAGLRLLAPPSRLRRVLHEAFPELERSAWRISVRRLACEIVRYKPEKRAVVRVTSRAIARTTGTRRNVACYIKVYPREHGATVASQLQVLNAALWRGVPSVPRLLAVAGGGGAIALEEIDGRDLRAILREPSAERTVPDVAGALAALHTLPIETWPRSSIADALEMTAAGLRALVVAAPEIGPDLEAALARLRAATPGPPDTDSFVHGDFHPGQVLVRAAGIGVLDFDRAHCGDSCADLGNLAAHLHPAAPESPPGGVAWGARVVEAYEDARGARLDRGRLRFWTALALLRLAARPFRGLETHWWETSARLAAACWEVLG